MSVVAQRLHLGRNGQCPAQPLVVDNRALVHLGKAVVGGVGEGGASRPLFDMAIGILSHLNVFQQVQHLGLPQREAL